MSHLMLQTQYRAHMLHAYNVYNHLQEGGNITSATMSRLCGRDADKYINALRIFNADYDIICKIQCIIHYRSGHNKYYYCKKTNIVHLQLLLTLTIIKVIYMGDYQIVTYRHPINLRHILGCIGIQLGEHKNLILQAII